MTAALSRRRLRASASLLALCLAPAALPAQVAPAANKTTLVVQISVDQLLPEYLDRYASQFTGGFARLLKQGVFYANAAHDHATTETAPGHATLWSGRHPSHTAIVLNDIGVADAQSPLLFGRGGGASPWRFRGSALFDWIRATDQFSRALSVSRKDRSAILPVGRAKQSVYWYSSEGRFTTSRYYADTVPTWVQRFNARDFVKPFLGAEWKLLLPAASYGEVDSVPYEHGGKDVVFPHRIESDMRTASYNFTEFPWMDEVTVDFALAGVTALDLGKGPTTDLLAISLSTLDAVGHSFGPDSREVHDMVLRVDRELGRFIDSLYTLRDSSRIVFALGSDHGVAPYPEAKFPGSDPNRGRVDTRPVIDAARSALAARGVEGDALTIDAGIVLLDRRRLRAKGVNADSVVTALRASLSRISGVQRVDRVSMLAANAARGDKYARLWRNSLPSDMPAVLTVTMKPYYYWFTRRYATHGTPHDYDARIPVMFMGPGIKAGRYTRSVKSVDVAPTLAAYLGIDPIEAVDGRVLTEIVPPTPKR